MEISISRRRLLVGAAVLAAALLAGSRLILSAGTAHAPELAVPIVTGAADGGSSTDPLASTSGLLVVDVVGAVRRPGLYRLPAGSRVAAAVAKAGGATSRADLEALNVAAPLADGQQVLVPRRIASGLPAPTGGASSAPAGPVQLSVATPEQLDSLPGIGPVTAQKIVDYRTTHGPFRSVDDLDGVPGIGPTRVEQLRGLVVP